MDLIIQGFLESIISGKAGVRGVVFLIGSDAIGGALPADATTTHSNNTQLSVAPVMVALHSTLSDMWEKT